MNNPRTRGLVFLVVGVVAAWFLCVFLPFTALPNSGIAIGLPVITVPGEIIHYNWLGGFDLTNTLMGGFLATLIIALWAGLSYRATKGWTREVPDRGQAFSEFAVETFYNFLEGLGGENFKKAPMLWPLAAAMFFFLIAGNLGKLLPGFESVGYIHCGHVGINGYARYGENTSGRLWVDRSLDAGTSQTVESEEACQHQLKVLDIYYGEYESEDYAEEREAFYARLAAIGGDVPEEFASATPLNSEFALTSTLQTAEEDDHAAEEVVEEEVDPATGSCLAYIDGAEAAAEEAALEGGEFGSANEGDAEEDHSEEEATESDDHASLLLTSTLHTEEAEDAHGEEAVVETVSPEVIAVAYEELVAAEEDGVEGAKLEKIQCEVTRMLHPGAIFPMSADELQANQIQPYIFAVSPWFRGVSTDLSMNFGLALISIIGVQIYGVIALGPAYFEKFVNITSLGKGSIIDVVVGLIEIISEVGKIISLAFRLFGNLFAGGIVLVMFTFLAAFGLPVIMMMLEVIIGTVQALVFPVLTVVFVVQAMEAHHGDDHDDHHEEAH